MRGAILKRIHAIGFDVHSHFPLEAAISSKISAQIFMEKRRLASNFAMCSSSASLQETKLGREKLSKGRSYFSFVLKF